MPKIHTIRSIAFACLLVPMGAWAQTAGEPPALLDWRAANDAVAQFKRGHIDLLKWESANIPEEAPAKEIKPNLMLMNAADMVRQAWRVHPDLVRVQSRLGAEVTQQIAEGRLDVVDPSLQRRVDDMDELIEVAADARKIWVAAVAAKQVLRFREAALISAEAGSELGRRMVSVGNWSPLQRTPFQLAHSAARMDLTRAKLDALVAEGALIKLLRLTGTPTVLGLPSALPELPKNGMERTAWEQRLGAVQAQLPDVEAVRNRVASQMAYEIQGASWAIAHSQRSEVLALRRFITEETVLHYNGMLKSVWDLLGEVSKQAVAEIDAIGAQRDFWLADADLQWTLQGGIPANFVSLGGGTAEAGGPAGH